jgi:hypothetical protein
MKQLIQWAAIAALALGTSSLRAADGKEVTVTGEGKCLKCTLGKSDKCQNVVEVKKGDKVTTYYLVGDASKAFHKNLCQVKKDDSKKVTVTGTCVKKDGMLEVTVAKIEDAK